MKQSPFQMRIGNCLDDRINALKVNKREQLVGYGDVAREIFFIDKGLLRLYGVKDGEEKTLFFFKEGMVASSLDSLLSEAPEPVDFGST